MSTSRGTTRIQRRDRKSRACDCALYTVKYCRYGSLFLLTTSPQNKYRSKRSNFFPKFPIQATHLPLSQHISHYERCTLGILSDSQDFSLLDMLCRCVVRRCVVRICVIKRFVSVSSRYISICTFTYQTEPTQYPSEPLHFSLSHHKSY